VTNDQVARVLQEIADLLEIKGENVFKVRSYARAAEAVSSLGEPIAAVAERGELSRLPGIGRSIAEKITELIETGRCQRHQELRAEFPPGLLDLLRVREIGPKTVKLLYEQLGIADLEELEAAAREHRLREVKGFGAKSEDNVLKGIERLHHFTGRYTLGVADPIARATVAALREQAPVDQIEVAGSLRRMKETIGDIDILVTSTDPEAVMEVFTQLPAVHEIVAKGPTKSTIATVDGLQMDVRVVAPSSFGAALQYFTGSREHSVRLRELAVRRKLRLNEYGVFRVNGKEKRIGGETEEQMYEALGLPWIPPELREDQGEIDAARENRLPDLIELKDVKGDLHVHTDWSDGHHTIEEMAEAARQRGYRYLVVSDHSPSAVIAGGLPPARLREQMKVIRALNRKRKNFTVFCGSEVDIKRDGSLDFPEDLLAELDFVTASVHSSFKLDARTMAERIIRAIENPYVDVIGHPTGRIIGAREPYEVDLDMVMRAAAQHKVALEINSFPDRLDLKDVHARRARDLGVPIIINTDAHDAAHLDLLRYGVAQARRGWITAADVVNCRPLNRLRTWINRRRKTRAHKT
jgi:DNA polymerase (family 10)